jgi:hypothetical protein
MQQAILDHLNNAKELEKLYRSDRKIFKQAFEKIYSDIKDHPAASFWHARLYADKPADPVHKRGEIWVIVILSLMAAFVAKIPDFFNIKDPGLFYPYNISFIVFPFLIFYFLWKHKPGWQIALFPLIAIVISVSYMNLLPKNINNSTIILACIHMPLFLWMLTGYAFVGRPLRDNEKRIHFLRYNGDFLIMSIVILLAGGAFGSITMGLFSLINIDISEIFIEYIVVLGAASTPLVGTYLLLNNPSIINKVSPIIARIFTPIVFIMLFIYLIAVLYTGKDPYNERDFLVLFNALLIGVMALIFFSLSDTGKKERGQFNVFILFGLALLTLIIDAVALSAIIFRIAEWGITPNRLVVLVSNLLILINLSTISWRLWMVMRQKAKTGEVESAIAVFLPLYGAWFGFVTFLLPLIFAFK